TILKGLRAAERLEREARDLNRRFGVFLHSGSNAWVVSPARTANGHALLWGGPQEGFDNPNIDWEMYIRARRMRTGGVMIAGGARAGSWARRTGPRPPRRRARPTTGRSTGRRSRRRSPPSRRARPRSTASC